jgi:hypothetical protein
MTDRPTPETDAFFADNIAALTRYPQIMRFCERLERERNAALAERDVLRAALELIAVPMRPDGTYNRDRGTCGSIARGALASLTQ